MCIRDRFESVLGFLKNINVAKKIKNGINFIKNSSEEFTSNVAPTIEKIHAIKKMGKIFDIWSVE